MTTFSRACWATWATLAALTAPALAAQDWAVRGGTVRLSLDSATFAKIGLGVPMNVETGATEFDLTLVVAPDTSDFRITTDQGATLAQRGYLRTSGQYFMSLGMLPDNGMNAVGDFLIQTSGNIATVTDGASTGRVFFELDPQSIAVKVDEGNRTAELSGELVISKSLAYEILQRPELMGTPIGSLKAETTVRTEAAPSGAGLGGIAGGTPNGPDVIVSTIDQMTRYGTVGTITAYAMTTVSCNLGEADAIWIDCTSGANCNQHPVIGQNLYRLKNGRFEQIGQAWLKHGFCAADAPSCGSPYEANNSCDWLGTHATDTYGASLNAQQSNLGPKSEIQPWTGVYPYPYVLAAGASGNAIYKRLQTQNDDVNPALNAGALYYGESQYVVTDEQTINRYNNVSYRRLTASGTTTFTLTFQGSTFAQQPAINAWAAADATVTLVNADAANDGRFILGYKVSSLGGGQFHYEYAVYNMNSKSAGQAFSVPIPAGVTVSNIGFHDVDYHSGEVYSNTDWTSSLSGGVLKWEGQTKATNINANALRWGTLYNFRFDANAGPANTDVTLTLFETGGTLAIGAAAPSVPCIPASITTPPVALQVEVGQPASFSVVAAGSDPLTYQWHKNGNNVGGNSSSFSIAAADYSDAGNYDVLVTNLCGNAQSTAVALTVVPHCLKGDANCDGSVNNFDIDFFVEAVLDNAFGYGLLGGSASCYSIRHCWGDLNSADGLNNFDIDPFVACVLSPPAPGAPCP